MATYVADMPVRLSLDCGVPIRLSGTPTPHLTRAPASLVENEGHVKQTRLTRGDRDGGWPSER